MADKERADILLVRAGLCDSRSKAQQMIMAGVVLTANGERIDKPGKFMPLDTEFRPIVERCPYVSRGGLKLVHALELFDIKIEGFVCMDIGASTGGFTDVMLSRRVIKVFAVDVGYGQLAWKIRKDPRVVVLERTNARNLDHTLVPEMVDFVTVDVSFISLEKVMTPVVNLMKPGAEAVTLIKPQFEAGFGNVGSKGVVRSPATHIEVLSRVSSSIMLMEMGLKGLTFSPIKGPEGNIEFLAYWEKGAESPSFDIESIVQNAHLTLGG